MLFERSAKVHLWANLLSFHYGIKYFHISLWLFSAFLHPTHEALANPFCSHRMFVVTHDINDATYFNANKRVSNEWEEKPVLNLISSRIQFSLSKYYQSQMRKLNFKSDIVA
ncbi:CLUMA_CG006132, isoform A [Clunio marinus]|uniref:CLUMA_CG006132, isoform A n=1 Tax=Clunio marinus TaxID=568069 RepID=A0A1J1I164_9DIPT|nr:CLUMA_CG006132, isoform A [Clunio marinus]